MVNILGNIKVLFCVNVSDIRQPAFTKVYQ